MTMRDDDVIDDDNLDDDQLDDGGGTDLAVVGVACRFPGAATADQYWENLRDGKESVVRLSDAALLSAGVSRRLLRDPAYVKAAAVLDDIDQFDAGFFGFSAREAQVLDPQHRFFLEVCWEALESAGHMPEQFDGRIGVFGGSGHNAYMPYNLFTNPKLMESMGLFLVRHTGNDKDFLATRVSYCLDLHGPAVNVQTACSTSLVAIHLAAQSLLGGECDMALAGGVTIELPHGRGYRFEEGEILSPDGHCRAFDHKSAGTVFGSGCGIVALRRLDDAIADGDTIFGVVKSTAINNDGSRKVGYLAPSVDGQAEAVVEAITLAGLDARDISYVECHGTGTPVGDPIEVTALTQAFRTMTEDNGFCRVGSVKTNIGHLDTAAGVASFIKVLQMMRHEKMAPTLHFEAPNPQIDFESSPFLVNDRLRPWTSPSAPRRAGISSLGVGGTNAHVIVEEAPPLPSSGAPQREPQLLVVSGRTPSALEGNIARLCDFLEDTAPDARALADIAHTLLVGRRRFPYRRAVVIRDGSEARAAFAEPDVRRQAKSQSEQQDAKVAFLFPGGGAQFPGMLREVYSTETTFRSVLDRCMAIIEERESISLAPILFPDEGDTEAMEAAAAELKRATRALPALLSVEVALAALWEEAGLTPAIAIGHSLGEYAAAYLAGVFSLEDALGIVSCRGRLFEACPPGAMSAVPLSEEDIEKDLPAGLDIAVVNGPESCVVSGPKAELEAYESALAANDIEARRLAIDVAAHSRMLDAVLEDFRAYLSKVTFSPPSDERPFVSNLSGAVAGEEVANADYWVRHLRSTVRFSDGLTSLLQKVPDVALLEVGPGQALTQISRMQPVLTESFRAVPTGRHAKDDSSELDHFLLAAGRLWCAGVSLSSPALFGEGRKRTQLPTYAFDHERHWVEPGDGFFLHADDDDLGRSDDVGAWFYTPSFQPAPVPPSEPMALSGSVVVLGEDTRLASRVCGEIRGRGYRVVRIAAGEGFVLDGDEGAVHPDRKDDYEALFVGLSERGQPAIAVVNLWTAEQTLREAPSLESLNQDALEAEVHHHLRTVDLLQAMESADATDLGYIQVTHGTFVATESDVVTNAAGALGLGPVRTAPKELPGLRAALVDIDAADGGTSVGALVDEILGPLDVAAVALRDGVRHVESWNAVAADEASMPAVEGAVVVTGGLGGIGRTIARGMAREGVHFVMVGRTTLPPRREWDEYLRTHEGDAVSAKLLAAKEIEDLGATVATCAADVADPHALRAAIESARKGHVVKGVIHAAGLLDDAPLVVKKRPEMEAVLAPKVAGQLALEASVNLKELDFFVAFSSTSVPLGPPGQVDYVAANAFLNARMQALRSQGIQALALGWGVWKDVGMAASAGRPAVGIAGEPVSHPLLQRCAHRDEKSAVYEALFSTDLWVLDEHRVRGQGAVVPGTALLEMIRAAAADAFFPDAKLALHDVEFLRPLALENDAPRKVVIEAVREGDEVTVCVLSDDDGDPEDSIDQDARLRAQGRVTVLEGERPDRVALEPQRQAHDDAVASFGESRAVLPQEQILDFGERWNVLESMRFSDEGGMATLSLPSDVESDLDSYAIHPGLWDIASGFAFGRLPTPSDDAIYVPVRYQEVRLYQDPTPKAVSLVRFSPGSEQNRMRLQMQVVDLGGNVIAEVDGYEVAAVPARALTAANRIRAASGPAILDELLADGITEEEGQEAFARALAQPHSVCIASPTDLEELKKAFTPAPKVAAQSGPAPTLDVGGPRDDTERLVLGLFRDLLGADHALITDNFFDLGGHSLIAVRLFSKIKKQTGVDLAIGTLFSTPTAETLAAAIRQELGIAFEPESESGAPPAVQASRGPQCLVPIQPGPEDARAFFCVHGAGGNVLNFSDLSRHLGKEIPFFGLQAKGVDGKEEPLHSIEEMAEWYLEGVRFVRPSGPYVLGGYSGGGAVALEMAKRLVDAGESVEAVVFLDTFRPGIGMRRPDLKARLEEARREGLSYLPNRIKARVSRQWREASLEVQRRIFEKAGAPPPLELREYQLTNAFAEAADRYSPSTYDGRVVLFRASETDLVYQHAGPTLGWDGLLPALEIHEVPGDHDSVTREPNIFEWIGTLRRIIVGGDQE